MSGTTTIPLQAPQFSAAVNDRSYFQTVWANYFDSVSSGVNAAATLANPTFTGTVTIPVLAVTGTSSFADVATFTKAISVGGNLSVTGSAGFNGATPTTKPNITGSRSSGAAFTNLLNALVAIGLVSQSTTA